MTRRASTSPTIAAARACRDLRAREKIAACEVEHGSSRRFCGGSPAPQRDPGSVHVPRGMAALRMKPASEASASRTTRRPTRCARDDATRRRSVPRRAPETRRPSATIEACASSAVAQGSPARRRWSALTAAASGRTDRRRGGHCCPSAFRLSPFALRLSPFAFRPPPTDDGAAKLRRRSTAERLDGLTA